MNDSLRADHSGLNKFNRRSPEYRNILLRLESIIDKSLKSLTIRDRCAIAAEQGRLDHSFVVDYEPIMEVVDELIGRENELRLIESYLQRKEGKGPTIVVLHGLGGIGKTQLASTYFNKPTQFYSARFRLDGSSRTNFESDFLKVTKAAGLNDDSAALSETPVQRTWDWLNLRGNSEWLILLDNVDDPGDSAEQFDVSSFLKNVRQGAVIITTRIPVLTSNSKLVPVGRLESKNALSLLKLHIKAGIPEGEYTFECRSSSNLNDRLRLHRPTRRIRRTSTCLSFIWCIYVPNWGVSLVVFGTLQRDVAIIDQVSGHTSKLPRQDT